MAEADALLTVSAGASNDRMRNAPAARALLDSLHTETALFDTKGPPPERYLFILVREGTTLTCHAFLSNTFAFHTWVTVLWSWSVYGRNKKHPWVFVGDTAHVKEANCLLKATRSISVEEQWPLQPQVVLWQPLLFPELGGVPLCKNK